LVPGANNQTLRNNGASWEASSVLLNNGTNVGIGGASFSEKLDVTGNVRASTGFLANSGSAGTPSFRFTDSPTTGIFRPAADVVGISTATVERVRVAANGNVGIGVVDNSSNPVDASERLQVNGNVLLSRGAARSLSVQNRIVDGADADGLTISAGSSVNGDQASSGGDLLLQAGWGNSLLVGDRGGHLVLRSGANFKTQAGGDIVLETGTSNSVVTERMRISHGGVFTLPTLNGSGQDRLLTISSAGVVSTSSIVPSTVGTVSSVGLSLPAIFSVSNSPVTTSGTLTGTLATQTANTVFSGPTTGGAAVPTFRSLVAADIPNLDASKITTGFLPIARGGTNSGTALNNNRVMVSSGGAIVENAALTANLPIFTDANGLPTTSAPATGVQGYWTRTGANELHNSTLTDKVGIGTATPATMLHVNSNNNSLAAGQPSMMVSGDVNKERIHVRSSTGDPVIALYKSGSGTMAAPGTTATGTLLGTYQFGGYDGTQWIRSSWIGASAMENFSASARGTDIHFSTTPIGSNTIQERMRIDASGNVGIGTDLPTSHLEVSRTLVGEAVIGRVRNLDNTNAASHARIQVRVAGANAGNPQFTAVVDGLMAWNMGIDNADADKFKISNDPTGNLALSTRLTIGATGNVGIGTAAPAAKLDIAAGADNNGANDQVALSLQYRAGGYRHFIRSRHNSTLTSSGNDIDFYVNHSGTPEGSSAPGTGNIHVLTLENFNGTPRVGIGTTSPTASLHVEHTGTATNTIGQFLTPSLAAAGATYLKLGRNLTDGNSADIVYSWTGNDHANNYLAFSFFGKPLQMILTNSGNLGIGSTLPTSKLDVVGQTATNQLKVNNLPAFCADLNTTNSYSVAGAFQEVTNWRTTGATTLFNNTTDFNATTGRFTAPRNGFYFFSAHIRIDGVSTDYARIALGINGAPNLDGGLHAIANHTSLSNLYHTLSVSGVVKLAAGQYVSVFAVSQGDATWSVQSESGFTGYLISDY